MENRKFLDMIIRFSEIKEL